MESNDGHSTHGRALRFSLFSVFVAVTVFAIILAWLRERFWLALPLFYFVYLEYRYQQSRRRLSHADLIKQSMRFYNSVLFGLLGGFLGGFFGVLIVGFGRWVISGLAGVDLERRMTVTLPYMPNVGLDILLPMSLFVGILVGVRRFTRRSSCGFATFAAPLIPTTVAWGGLLITNDISKLN